MGLPEIYVLLRGRCSNCHDRSDASDADFCDRLRYGNVDGASDEHPVVGYLCLDCQSVQCLFS